MSMLVQVTISLIALLLVISALIVVISRGRNRDTDNETKLTVEIPKLLKVNFEQKNKK